MEYFEQWTRVAEATAGSFAVRLENPDQTRSAYVLNVGPYVFYARVDAPMERTNGECHAEFSLFEASQEGSRLVLSTASPGQASCPVVEFPDAAHRTAWLSWLDDTDDKPRELWTVTALDDCGAAKPTAIKF